MIELLWIITYRYRTKPLYRKGRWERQQLTFKAENRMEALRAAKAHAEQIWNRRRYEILDCIPTVNRSKD